MRVRRDFFLDRFFARLARPATCFDCELAWTPGGELALGSGEAGSDGAKAASKPINANACMRKNKSPKVATIQQWDVGGAAQFGAGAELTWVGLIRRYGFGLPADHFW